MQLKFALPIFIASAIGAGAAFAQDLDLSGYQEDNGAVTTMFHGDVIDPYFATKALLLAQDGELDSKKQSEQWVKWAIHAQRGDGLFNRYARDVAIGDWKVVDTADADDAMQAIWLELLYRLTPKSGMSPQWQDSAARAEKRLDELFSESEGVYHISVTLPVGLLMDNMEIYSAFKDIAKQCKRLGLVEKEKSYEQKAQNLRDTIHKIFGHENGIFTVSTQERDKEEFYPDRVAQIFPVLYGLQTDTSKQVYENWLKANGKEWIAQRTHDFAWGLVAITALDMGDADSASCWQNRAEPMRFSGHWNILEEVSLQSVKYRLLLQKYDKVPCTFGGLV